MSNYYEVEYCLDVDHPELRDYAFERRDKHRVVLRAHFKTQTSAVGFFEAILAGNSDYSSEYVAWAAVYHVRPGKRVRCVRKRVYRKRPARWVYDYTPTPEDTRGWSLLDGTPFIYCEKCRLTLDDGFPCKHVDQNELEDWLALGSAQ